MGMSAIQYLNSYRLKIAHTMLQSTGVRIREIAYACGFEDVGYFCRLYKRKFGMTPKNR
jgi:AraC-like DNA-binding protein